MDHRFSALASRLTTAAAVVWTHFTDFLLFQIASPAAYQPEKYYMRGPGPKWREKHPSR
jgi:hypothetical protein